MKFHHALAYMVLVAYSVCSESSVLAAQAPEGCRADLLSTADEAKPPIYSPRAHGAYCEGNVPVLQAGEIDLIGLTLGPITYTQNNPVLHIQRPSEIPAAENALLEGLDDRPESGYRLDGLLPATGLDIDTTFTIKPIGINQDHLALLVRRQTAHDGTEYWPASSTAAKGANPELATIKIAIAAIYVSVARCTLPDRHCDGWERVATQVGTGAVVKVPLAREPKTRVIELNVKVDGDMGLPFNNAFRIAIPGTG